MPASHRNESFEVDDDEEWCAKKQRKDRRRRKASSKAKAKPKSKPVRLKCTQGDEIKPLQTTSAGNEQFNRREKLTDEEAIDETWDYFNSIAPFYFQKVWTHGRCTTELQTQILTIVEKAPIALKALHKRSLLAYGMYKFIDL